MLQMADDKRYEITVVPDGVRFLADQSDPRKNQFVFSYTITITNTGDDRGAAREPALDHHRRASTRCRKSRACGVVGQQPLLKPGESFEYTSGASIPTAVGTMRGSYQMRAEDGQTFDAPDSALHAVRCRARSIRGPSSVAADQASARAGGLRRAFIVHHTMATAISSATSASSRNHSMATPSLRLRAHLRARSPAALAVRCLPRRLAGCQTTPAAGSAPLRRCCRQRHLRHAPVFTPAAWTELPGLARRSGRRRVARVRSIGCRALLADPKTQPLWHDAVRRRRAQHVDATHRDAVRAFFDAHFSPYRVAPPTANDVRTRNRLLRAVARAARARARRNSRCRSMPPPDDLLTVELARSLSGAQGQACAAASTAGRSCRTGRAPRSRSGAPSLAGKVLAYVADPVEAFFLEIQGSGPHRAAPMAA